MVDNLRSYLRNNLSSKRFRHSESTGQTAIQLCTQFGISEQKGLIAGLGHDIAREMDRGQLIELASSMFPVEFWEREKKMLHGKAGAVLLHRKFEIEDREILEAVAWHTTGTAGMGDLAKIVYIADYIEPNRKHAGNRIGDNSETNSLDTLFYAIFMKKLEYLKASEKKVAPPTVALYESLQDQRLIS